MELSSIVIIEANFFLIALLPLLFFRGDGKFNFLWCLTALPFCLALIALIKVFFDPTGLMIEIGTIDYQISQAVGVILSCASIGLITMTIGSHRIPLALWHQNPELDKPQEIVTWGSYKYIRHPFYSSFILCWLSSIAIAPHWSIFALAIYSFILLIYTANKEEIRLSNQEGKLGLEYKVYLKRTGRFFPRIILRNSELN